uniref:Uncharacterized protein n=1 Tax=Arundo donax TaxID=35708 RepID=A0A0A9ETI4_ARUDO
MSRTTLPFTGKLCTPRSFLIYICVAIRSPHLELASFPPAATTMLRANAYLS